MTLLNTNSDLLISKFKCKCNFNLHSLVSYHISGINKRFTCVSKEGKQLERIKIDCFFFSCTFNQQGFFF